VNPTDGSCWVVVGDSALGYNVIHLTQDGTEVSRTPLYNPRALCVDPKDGSCWVTGDAIVYHLDQAGTQIWSGTPAAWSASISVNPTDSSCWVADFYGVRAVHLAANGDELLRWGFKGPGSLSVNSADGSCWVADRGNQQVAHLAKNGKLIGRPSGLQNPYAVAANGTDGSCWVTDISSMEVVHFAQDGTELSRTSGFNTPEYISVNLSDGSCWVADGFNNQVVHLSQAGTQLWRGGTFNHAKGVSVNPTDGSCWVADWNDNQVVHLAVSGAEISRLNGFANPESVAVDPTDGSCWVADTYHDQVVHLAVDGSELWRGGNFYRPPFVSVNPNDGTCWVAGAVHLSKSGTELGRTNTIAASECVSVNPVDGTCWVADTGNNQVVRLGIAAPPVADFVASPSSGSAPLTVSFTDQSTGFPTSWLWDLGDGITSSLQNPTHRYSKAGNFTVTVTVSNTAGMNAKTTQACVQVTFSDAPPGFWASAQIVACANAGIVTGYSDGTYKPTDPVTRDQMAVYVSRALAGGDAAVPTGPATGTFSDVPTDYWAFKYVEYAAAQNVVQGYSDGTYKPTDQVDRGQMAVFIARSIYTPTAARPDLTGYAPPATATFPDVPTNFWAYKYVEYIAQPGIDVTKGYPDGDYHPEYVCTRDQMAVYIQRAFKLPL